MDDEGSLVPVPAISPAGRGGPWMAVVLATIGVGIILSGAVAGSPGLIEDAGRAGFWERLAEAARECVRIVIFSGLLLAAVHAWAWRARRPVGDLLLASARCLAVIAIVEAVRVVHVPGAARPLLIGAAQFLLLTGGLLGFFRLSIREATLLAVGCGIGIITLWLGAHLGTWIA